MTDSLLHVGATVLPGGFSDLADSIASIIRVGHECHMDQATVAAAIAAFSNATRVSDVSITDSTFNGSGDTWEYTPEDIDDEDPVEHKGNTWSGETA